MKEFLDLVTGLGPAGLFALAAYVMWRERDLERKRNEQLWALLLQEKQTRIDDQKLTTTAMLSFAEQFSDAREERHQ